MERILNIDHIGNVHEKTTKLYLRSRNGCNIMLNYISFLIWQNCINQLLFSIYKGYGCIIFFSPEITKSHWIPSETCPTCCNKQCRRKFSLLDRPHHCRRYKDVFVKHLIIVSILRAISKVSTFWHFHTWIHVKVHVTNVRQ